MSTPSLGRTPAPQIEPYQSFARNLTRQDKVVGAINGNELTMVPREQLLLSKAPQIVAHFKAALENRYGKNFAKLIFHPDQEAKALQSGLSHAIVSQVFKNAQTTDEYDMHAWKAGNF